MTEKDLIIEGCFKFYYNTGIYGMGSCWKDKTGRMFSFIDGRKIYI